MAGIKAIFASVFRFQGNPHVDRGDDLAGRGLAYVDAFGGDQFARGKVEAGPWLWHAAEGHFLDWPSGDGVHDRCGDTHVAQVARGGPVCPSGGCG